MVERDDQRARDDQPISRTRVASPLVVSLEHRVLNIDTADTQEFGLDDRVVCPDDKSRLAGHAGDLASKTGRPIS
jgi:hypothetical protein